MTRRLRRSFAGCALVAVVLASGVASAQPSEKDADAERLFREGQKLMEQKRLGEACPKFEAAYKKDEQLGTLLNLAYCHKQQGAIWQAWLEFKEAEVKAVALKRIDRRDFARQRMTELEKTLSKVVVDPTSKVELTQILVEDRRVFDAEKNVTFAAEAGPERKITFLAKGKRPAIQLVAVPTQKKGEGPLHITVPEMDDEPPPAPAVVEAPVVKTEPVHVSRIVPRDNHAGAWRKAMIVTLAVGVPVLAAGAVLGVITLGSDCTPAKRAQGFCRSSSDRASASTIAMFSGIGIAAGGVLTATGLGILFFGPKPAKSSRDAWVAPDLGPGWAGVHGAF